MSTPRRSLSIWGLIFTPPNTTVELRGNRLSTKVDNAIDPGINANIQYYFHPVRQVVRALYTLINPTNADIDVEARVGGNLGSDSNTTVRAT